MRILVVCNKSPFPTVDGGTLAMAAILETLHRLSYDVVTVVYDTPKHPFSKEAIPAHLQSAIDWHPVPVNNKIYPTAAAWHIIKGDSYILDRFHTSGIEQYLENLLHDHVFDLVHLDSLFTLGYADLIRSHTKAPIVYRAHNIEYRIWEMMQSATNQPLKRKYLQVETKKLKAAEAQLIEQVDGILAISPQDLQWFQEHYSEIPMADLPFAMDLPSPEKITPPNAQVFHLGAMDWLPNQEAIRWLLKEVWPLVVEQEAGAQLHLAGRHMPKDMLACTQSTVTVSGAIPDAQSYMLSHGIMVVPLLAGSGLRIKIIEGMALGRAVVTTTQGLQGIPASPGKEVWVADSAEDMATALVSLIRDEALRQAIGQTARQFIAERYTLEHVGKQLAAFYHQMTLS